jgi:enamine deaminase RidA (YjgF/YER057c/UK114 family)
VDYVVTLSGTIAVVDDDGNRVPDAGDLIEQHLDVVMDALEGMGVGDPDIELDLTDCSVRVAILVVATDPDHAIATASPLMREAIHAAGGSTPDWPDSDHRVWSVRRITLSVSPVELVAA